MRAGRRYAYYAILVVFVIVTVEGLAAAALYVAEQRHPGLVLDLFIANHFSAISRDHIEDYRDHHYDARLGWDYQPGSDFTRINSAGEPYLATYAEDGARRHGRSSRPLGVAAYGDSFTAGVGVNDDETWPYFLELILERGVKNFGTGAYGTDQAVLKFEGHVRSGTVAPVTILGIHEENIKRIVNTFRPFYITETGIELAFKPRYRCDGDQDVLRLEANPLAPFEEDVDALRRIAREAAKRDLYAHHMVHFSPPFLPKAIQVLAKLARYRLGQESWLDPGSLDFWADPKVSHLMGCIIRHFVALARRSGSTPVLLFLPKNGEPRGDAPLPEYDPFIERLKERQPELLIVDISRERFDPGRFLNIRYSGHPSPYGNRVIAQALARAIEPVLRDASRPPGAGPVPSPDGGRT